MLSTCIKHWMFDVGISKLFDNITNNLKPVGKLGNLSNPDRENIQKELLRALVGYPYSTVHENDYEVIMSITKINLLERNMDLTPSGEAYVISLHESIVVPKK